MRVHRKTLTTVLALAAKIATPRQSQPILGAVLLRPGDGTLTLEATDLERFMHCPIQAPGAEPGPAFALEVRAFAQIVKGLPKADRTVEIIPPSTAWDRSRCQEVCTCHDDTATPYACSACRCMTRFADLAHVSGVRLLALSGEDFPEIPTPPEGTPILRPLGLVDALRTVAYAMSRDTSRYALNGAWLDHATGRVAATDGHRLAVVQVEPWEAVPTASGWIPMRGPVAPRALVELLGSTLVANAFAQYEAAHTATGRVAFALQADAGPGWLGAEAIDGQFPNIDQVIPKRFKTTLTVPRVAFLEAIQRAKTMAEERTRPVRLDVTAAGVSIYAAHYRGEITLEVPGSVTGPALRIGLNSNYLLDALAPIDLVAVTLQFNGDNGPMLIQAKEYTSLLMPMRL